jgi:hypothetical protein
MVAQWDGTLLLRLYCLSSVYFLSAVTATNRTSVVPELAQSPESCYPSEVCTTTGIPPIIPVAEECGIWIALSTIPGAGLGIFAGKKFRRNEALTLGGDQTIPIVDFTYHQEGLEESFLWDDYTWVRWTSDCQNLWNEATSLYLIKWAFCFRALECGNIGYGKLGMEGSECGVPGHWCRRQLFA